MLSFRMAGYAGYGVAYSPFFDNKIAVAAAANYGLVGNGRLYFLDIRDDGSIVAESAFDTQDGLFDLAWSEVHENHVVAASGDGSIKMFDRTVPQYPVMNWQEHQREVFSVNWNLVDKTTFASASWDGTIKIWSPNRPTSLTTLSPQKDFTTPYSPLSSYAQTVKAPLSQRERDNPSASAPAPAQNCIYSVQMSPHSPQQLISAHSNSHVQLWDLRAPTPLQLDFVAHAGFEVLSLDWNKYRPTIIASAGVDRSVKIWDLRMIQVLHQPPAAAPSPGFHAVGPSPLNELIGHEYAVRNVKWSPHRGDVLVSVSYDMTAKVWRDQIDDKARFLTRVNHSKGLISVFDKHREFVVGCDWSMWGAEGWCCTTGWDEMVYVWNAGQFPARG